MPRNPPLAVFVLLMLALTPVFQLVHYWPELPDVLASQFASDGSPSRFAPKGQFAAILGGTSVLVAALFLLIPWLLPRVPSRLISMPNRKWLEDPFRDVALRKMASQLTWLGVATLSFLVVVTQWVIEANLLVEPRVERPLVLLILAYVVLTTCWTVRLVVYFSRDPERVLGDNA